MYINNQTMTAQKSLNTSFPKNEEPLYYETLRISQLTHTPSSMLIRGWIRDGIRNLPNEAKLMCGLQYQPNH